MRLLLTLSLLCGLAAAQMSSRSPNTKRVVPPSATQEDIGEALYLNPYLEDGDAAGAKEAARVTEALPGFDDPEEFESYAGLITVDAETDSHMFFWFFLAEDVDPADAPVIMWLQGGPGSSSMFGLFEINGPISAVEGGPDGVTGVRNVNAWSKVANVVYIDNPVGTGFSQTTDGFVTDQDGVARDLYECLTQFFTIFPEFQENDFFAFGESYAGKYVPAISYKIHTENLGTPELAINLKGLAVGNGGMSPPDSFIYGDYLFELGLVDDVARQDLLEMEQGMKDAAASEQWREAWEYWVGEEDRFLEEMGCSNTLDWTTCDEPPETQDYVDYVNLEATRSAIHVGDIQFGDDGGVYTNLIEDFFKSEREHVEALLEEYPVMFYNGNNDIVSHHTGIMEMFFAMENWSGKEAFLTTQQEVYYADGIEEPAGYIRSVDNLRLLVIRNASHTAPRDKPEVALDFVTKFIRGEL